ncbi:MAG: hypothetical protein NZ824_11680 [Candidatus Thioglobus sp.]|nr:hypothetical protein [Candidatus Thioglobus sp.]
MVSYLIGGVMVSMLALSVLDPWDRAPVWLTKDYKSGICCFSATQAALRSKNKDWPARNQNIH